MLACSPTSNNKTIILHTYFHYAWQFALLTTVIMIPVHRTPATTENSGDIEHHQPHQRRKSTGRSTDKGEALPKILGPHLPLCWPRLLSFLSSSHRSFFGPQLFFSGHIGPFFGPHLFLSGNISPFLGHNFTFQVTLVLFLGHTFSFRATSVF